MLQANFTALSVIGTEYCQSKFYIAVIGIFYVFCSRDLDLDPMTFICEHKRIPWWCTGWAKMNFLCRGFKSYRLTNRQGWNYIPRHFTGSQKAKFFPEPHWTTGWHWPPFSVAVRVKPHIRGQCITQCACLPQLSMVYTFADSRSARLS